MKRTSYQDSSKACSDITGLQQENEEEDYNRLAKQKVLNRQIVVSILQLIFGLCLCVCGYFIQNISPAGYKISIILGLLGIILSLVCLWWCFKDLKVIKSEEGQWHNTPNHYLSRFLFIAAITLALSFATLLISSFVYLPTIRNYILANSSNDSSNLETFISPDYLLLVFTGILIGNILTSILSAFSAYVFSNSPTAFRFALYYFNMLAICISGGLIYIAISSSYFEEAQVVSEVVDPNILKIFFFLIAAYLLTLIALLAINFTKAVNYYFSIAALILLITIGLVSFNGQLYRQAADINNYVSSNCQNQLQLINQNYLANAGCPNKYIDQPTNSVFPNCNKKFQAIFWENDIDKENILKQRQITCLNQGCCGIAGTVYSDSLLLIATLGLMVSLVSFVIIGICCFLSTRLYGNRSLNRKIETMFILSCVIIFISWAFAILFFPFSSIQEKPGSVANLPKPDVNDQNYKLYSLNQITKHSKCEEAFSTVFQLHYGYPFSKSNAFDCLNNSKESEDCNGTILRVGVTGSYYTLSVRPSFNDPNVKVYDNRFARLFNDNREVEKGQSFVGAEGSVKDILNFFSEQVCITSSSPEFSHDLAVRASKISTKEKSESKKTIPFHPKKNNIDLGNSLPIQNIHSNVDLLNTAPFQSGKETEVDKNVSFETIEVILKEAETGKPLAVNATLEVYLHNIECIIQDKEPSLQLSQSDGRFFLRNMQLSTYTIFVKADGYLVSCNRLTLSQREGSEQQIIYLNRELKDEEIRIVLEQNKNNFDAVDLMVIMNVNSKIDCVVGYLNGQCPEMKYERTNNSTLYQSIFINRLGRQSDYLIYIKLTLSLNQFKTFQESGKTNVNELLEEAGTQLTIYVAGLRYPVFETKISSIEVVSNEPHLVWLTACMNGQYGNQVSRIAKYWVQNSSDTYILKQQDQNLPPAEICSAMRSTQASSKIV